MPLALGSGRYARPAKGAQELVCMGSLRSLHRTIRHILVGCELGTLVPKNRKYIFNLPNRLRKAALPSRTR